MKAYELHAGDILVPVDGEGPRRVVATVVRDSSWELGVECVHWLSDKAIAEAEAKSRIKVWVWALEPSFVGQVPYLGIEEFYWPDVHYRVIRPDPLQGQKV